MPVKVGNKMKKIDNWTVCFIDDMGNVGIGLLLPGCIVKGKIVDEIQEEYIQIHIIDVDISNLIITSTSGEQYLLLGASREYLQDIKKCIEIGLKERNEEER